MTGNGEVSFWYTADGVPEPRPALPGDLDADVAIVGAGFTGLWSAYYLKRTAPELNVVVLEARFAGFGASGRNGGWLANTVTGGREHYVRSHGRGVVGRFQELLNETIDEVRDVARRERIDADIVKGGELLVARNEAQHRRLLELVAHQRRWPEDDARLLSAAELRRRIAVAGARGGMYIPHCARIQPAKLVRGLARAVEALGVPIFEQTAVSEIRPGRAVTDRGVVSARYVLRATEGFTADLKGLHREWLPMNSSMIVTEPLGRAVLDEIGWAGCETLEDLAHAYVYLQRTADNRIAIGGRGVPYRFGSHVEPSGATPEATVAQLTRILRSMFPATAGVAIDHAWSGVLGVPRDWKATVGLDPGTGIGWAGGYVGTGVTATNLAGRTLTDLVLGRRSELTAMPWANRRVRRWEVEPLRWLGVRGLYRMYRRADAREAAGLGHASGWARVADAVSGRSR